MQEICLQHVAADGFPQVLPTTGWDLWQSWFLKTKLPLLWGTNKEENITAPKYIGYVQSSRRTTTMQSFNIVFLFCLLKHKWLCWATHKVNALFSHSFGHVHAILCNLMFKSSICVKAKVFISIILTEQYAGKSVCIGYVCAQTLMTKHSGTVGRA